MLILLKHNGSSEVAADSDLLEVFIYTEQVFIGTGQQLNVDPYGYSHIKPKVSLTMTVPFHLRSEIFSWTVFQCLHMA